MKTYSVLSFILCFMLPLIGMAQVTAEGSSASGILDSRYPEVTVQSPNGGEIYQIGDSVDISWSAIDSSFGDTPVSLYYSADSGLTFSLIVDNIDNSGSYRWEIPDDPSLNVLIRTTAMDSFGLSGADTSDMTFKIDGPPDPPQNLTYALANQSIMLRWDSASVNDVTQYYIYRSLNAGIDTSYINRIDTVYTSDTAYTDTNVQHDSTYYYIITAVDSLGNQSAASEQISATAYVLQITAVSFEQRHDGSKVVDITYTFSGNPVGTYTIYPVYSLDNGQSWIQCNTSNISGDYGTGIDPGSHTITWEFGTAQPNTYSSRARLKISAEEESGTK